MAHDSSTPAPAPAVAPASVPGSPGSGLNSGPNRDHDHNDHHDHGQQFVHVQYAPVSYRHINRPCSRPCSSSAPDNLSIMTDPCTDPLWIAASSSSSSLSSPPDSPTPLLIVRSNAQYRYQLQQRQQQQQQQQQQQLSKDRDSDMNDAGLALCETSPSALSRHQLAPTDLHSSLSLRQRSSTSLQPQLLPSELILHIFKFLASPHDLRSAILVCRHWCSCGIDLLWSRPTPLTTSALERMVQSIAGASSTSLATQGADQALNNIFPYKHYIRRLNLAFVAPNLTDEALLQFADCPRLERLILPGGVQATFAGLQSILTNRPNLASLDVSEIPAVNDALIQHIASQCPGLHTLNLGSSPSLTDGAIEKLAVGCPQLKRIKLSQCVLLTDRSVLALTERCPQLIEIDLTNCHQLTDEAVESIFKSYPQMRDVNLTLTNNITDNAFAFIHPSTHRFEQLRVLQLTSCTNLTDETLTRIISAAPRLRSLALTKCDKITDVGASTIKTLGKHLHYLHLGHCNKITDRLIAILAQHCTRIRYLDLACCSRLTDISLFALSQLPKLRRIGLVKCSNITDHGIYALVSLALSQTLERVHLSYCIHLSETAVTALVNQCSKLTHLSLTGVPAFMSPRYQKHCRAPPPELSDQQRDVFCVFSGKGVRDLRNSMFESPAFLQAASNLATIRASYRIMSSTVAALTGQPLASTGSMANPSATIVTPTVVTPTMVGGVQSVPGLRNGSTNAGAGASAGWSLDSGLGSSSSNQSSSAVSPATVEPRPVPMASTTASYTALFLNWPTSSILAHLEPTHQSSEETFQVTASASISSTTTTTTATRSTTALRAPSSCSLTNTSEAVRLLNGLQFGPQEDEEPEHGSNAVEAGCHPVRLSPTPSSSSSSSSPSPPPSNHVFSCYQHSNLHPRHHRGLQQQQQHPSCCSAEQRPCCSSEQSSNPRRRHQGQGSSSSYSTLQDMDEDPAMEGVEPECRRSARSLTNTAGTSSDRSSKRSHRSRKTAGKALDYRRGESSRGGIVFRATVVPPTNEKDGGNGESED